jgi:hypothetical protein
MQKRAVVNIARPATAHLPTQVIAQPLRGRSAAAANGEPDGQMLDASTPAAWCGFRSAPPNGKIVPDPTPFLQPANSEA